MGEISYYSPVRDGDVVYSCDMIRYKFFVKDFYFNRFTKAVSDSELKSMLCDDFEFSFRIEEYYSRKTGSYQALYIVYCDNDSVIKIGAGFLDYANNHPSNQQCFIEFNPNKADMGVVMYFKSLIEYYAHAVFMLNGELKMFELARFDLAIDIPVPRQNVVLMREGKKEYHKIIAKSITEYTGKRLSSGFTKVYDKTVESDLSYACTRVEVTCDSWDDIKLPKIYIISECEDDMSELTATDKVLVRLIRGLAEDEQQHTLRELGYVKRKKIEKYIFPSNNMFKFNLQCINWVITFMMDDFGLMKCVYEEDWEIELREKKRREMENAIYQQLSIFDKQFVEVTE